MSASHFGMYLSEIGGWAFSPKVLVAVVLILTVVIYVVLEEEYERRTKNICVRGGMLSDLFFLGSLLYPYGFWANSWTSACNGRVSHYIWAQPYRQIDSHTR
jgi:hypothetical protein